MNVRTLAWCLPRPRVDKFRGGFPLHFEKRLLRLLNHPNKILHPFGGRAESGIRIDLRSGPDPDIIADAHKLPIKNGSVSCVILDPPYSDDYGKRLYGTPPVKFGRYLSEAMRVLKEDGFLVFYHIHPIPCPKGCRWFARIYLETRQWHKLRWVGIFRKGFKTTEPKNLMEFT